MTGAQCAIRLKGAGNQARFDYWYRVLKAHKLMANFASELNQYEAKTKVNKLKEAAGHRSQLARLWEQIMTTQVQRVYDEVDLGVILNLQWRTWHNWVEGKYDKNFLQAGGTLPQDKEPSQKYGGKKYITCMPLRTLVTPAEVLTIKALIMGDVNNAVLHYRRLGSNSFNSIPMTHVARSVFKATIPRQKEDFEWYVMAKTSLGDVVFPVTAEADRMYQTVVVHR
jgi:hypothetical protein